jgi:hypothetical protein
MLPSRMVGRCPRDLRAGDHRDVDYRAILRLRSEWAGRKAIGLCYQRGVPWMHRGVGRRSLRGADKVRTRIQLFVLRGSG